MGKIALELEDLSIPLMGFPAGPPEDVKGHAELSIPLMGFYQVLKGHALLPLILSIPLMGFDSPRKW